ncbi:hypothetical protein JW851_02875 [Candidatus Woesearchaeota archaeon]|nr:hypothetical protein [Candidatus Woesearchaeota archaeon]
MTEDSVAITYETLYEILRAEKNKEELCELDANFYTNILEYLREKTKIFEEASSKNDIFSIDERDNTQVQLQNIKKIIKEIYERREKKIIDIALNKSRTNSDIIDTTNLLNPEQTFFNGLTNLLDKFRLGILAQIIALQEPIFDQELDAELLEQNARTKAEQTKKETLIETEYREELPAKETEMKKETKRNMKKIKAVQPIEQFIGTELEMYGPYKEDDVAEVPLEIAEILIKKGSAIEIE